MKKGKVFILSGPSGSGKTTLYKKLLESPTLKGKLIKTVSVTTRSKRCGEKHGRDYFFISPKMFLYKKRAGHFLEAQMVFDHYYGTPKKYFYDLLKKNKNILLCVDVKGSKVICRKIPNAIKIFIKTPSVAILEKRLSNRGSENKKTGILRLETACKELKEAKYYDVVIINDVLDEAYKDLETFIFLKLHE